MKPKVSRYAFVRTGANVALVSAFTLCLAGFSSALELNWNTTTGNFETASNWLVGGGPGVGVPGALDAAQISNGGTAQYTAAAAKTVQELRVANGSGSGNLDISGGGTFTATNAIWAGRQNGAGAGVISVSGANTVLTTATGNTFVGVGETGVGSATGGATGVLNISAGALLNHAAGGQSFRIGDTRNLAGLTGDYKGTLNVNGGTLTVGSSEFFVGNDRGIGTLNLGTGGTINVNNWMCIGRNSGNGTMAMTGGTLNKTGGGNIAIGDRATGILTQSGGAINIPSGEFFVGNESGPNGNGTYELSAGSLTINNWFCVARFGANGTLNMTGGTITKNGGGQFLLGTATAAQESTAIFNQSGGTININSGNFWVGEGANTTATISGTAQLNTPTIQIAVRDTTRLCTLSLKGGTVRTGRIFGGGGVGKLEFDGSLVQATRDELSFLHNIDTVEILAGGALIDSNGFNLNSPEQVIGGTGNFTKQGLGTLNLLGANTYSGTTTVSGGNLTVSTASLATGAVTVANSAAFGVTVVPASESYSTSAMTVGTSTLEFNLGNAPAEEALPPLIVSGALTVNAPANSVTINVNGTDLYVGTFKLLEYGSLAGTGGFPSFKIGTLPLGVSATLVNNVADKTIDLNITRVSTPKWDGGTSATWDINTTPNWLDGEGSPTNYISGDPATFNDEASGTTDVELDITVAPVGFIFDNAGKEYTLSGSGKVTGSTGLTKRGAATAAISTVNDFTGVTRVEAGTLSVATIGNGGAASAIGSSSAAPTNLVLAGGGINYTGATATTDRGFTYLSPGETAVNSSFGVSNASTNLKFTGTIDAKTVGFYKKGPGTLTLGISGTQALSTGGPFQIHEGTLALDGTGTAAPQVLTHSGEFHVGSIPEVGANLTMTNSVLTTTSWFAIGRGTGTNNSVSTVTLNNSTLNVNQISTGYNNGIAANVSTQNFILNDSKFNNTGGNNNIAENRGSTTNIFLNGNSEANITGASWRMGFGGGDAAGAANSTMTISGTSKFTLGSATNVQFASIGYQGGGSLTIENDGSFTNFDDFSVNEASPVPTVLTLRDNATLSTRKVYIGRGGARVGTVEQSGGTFTVKDGADMVIALNGIGTYNMSGGSASVGGWVSIGNANDGVGVLNVTGGTFNQTAAARGFVVGDGGTGRGTMTVAAGGTINSQEFRIGWSGAANGTVTQTGGTTTIAKGILMGDSGTTVGALNIGGGTFTVNSAGGNNVQVGNNGEGRGTLTITDGEVKLLNNANLRIAAGSSNKNNVATLGGGSLTFYSDATAVGGTGQVVIGSATATGTNTFNLNGGVLTVPSITSQGSTSLLNLNGGTLRATAATPTFISGITNVYLLGGGVTIDSGANDITIPNAISDGGGAGAVTKLGTGNLTLSGQNGYLGNTNISAGRVTLAAGAKLSFFVSPGVNNRITGTGAATLDGSFEILFSPTISGDHSWTLVDGAVNETYGATFSLVGFTEAANVWTRTTPQGTWTFTEATGVLTLGAGGTPGDAYTTWIEGFYPNETNPAIIGKDADPDGDGVPNALEYALGGSPKDGNSRAKVYSVKADSNADSQQELILTIAVRTGTSAFSNVTSPVATTSDSLITYTIQGSADLGSFTSSVTRLTTPIVTGNIPASPPSGYEYRSFSLTSSNGLPNKGFLRVKVDY